MPGILNFKHNKIKKERIEFKINTYVFMIIYNNTDMLGLWYNVQ